MIFRLVAVCFLSGAAFFAGCASSPVSLAPAAQPAEPVQPAPSGVTAPPAAAAKPASVAGPLAVKRKKAEPEKPETVFEEPALLPGEYSIHVTSEPSGATVVLNGRPYGRTPCEVVVLATSRGFLREQASIKVRFIAANEGESSQTVEEVLTTLDKVPVEIRFTTAGGTRVVR